MEGVKFYQESIVITSNLASLNVTEKNILVDLTDPTRTELQKVSELFEIPYSDLTKALDPNERPTIELSDKFSRITVSAPIGTNGNSKTISISFFLGDNYLIILKKKTINAFDRIDALPKENYNEAFSKDISHLFRFFLEYIINDYFHVIDNIEDEIDKIENRLFKKFENNTILKSIFKLKKTLIYFHKSLIANREVLQLIEKEGVKQIKKSDLVKYRNIYLDISQLIDMVGTHREILTGSMDIYMSAVSNNLNGVMKKLTVYASYVMVPTLISGIYGMNFQFLPETQWEYGYFFALSLMVVSVLLIRHSFKKQGWV